MPTQNIELIFTLADLLTLFEDEYQRYAVELVTNIPKLNGLSSENINKYGRYVYETMEAKNAFARIINYAFANIIEDNVIQHVNSSSYLGVLISKLNLKSGDSIITTNWDMCAEYELYKQGRWNISEGYGFDAKIIRKIQHKKYFVSPVVSINNASHASVLKLHGSVGWFQQPDGEIYIGSYKFLKYLGIDEPFLYKNNITRIGVDIDAAAVFPTYVKAIKGKLLKIWQLASHQLHHAAHLIIIGYSLPEADMGARSLLLPVREKIESKKLNVDVVIGEGNFEIKKRWNELFGDNIKIHEISAKNFAMSYKCSIVNEQNKT